jgi:drug/metabolite transporter (DMT)-like permease
MAYLGELSALLAALCWSGSSFAFSSASKSIGPLQLNINRMILAVIFLFFTILIFDIKVNLSSFQLTHLILSGAFGLVFGDTFLFKAYQHIGARISMLLMSVSPILSALLAYLFLNEIITTWGIIGMTITIAGVSLVIFERSEIPSTKYKISKVGIFYGLLGALGQSVGLIFAKYAFNAGEINGFVATFIRLLSAVLLMLPVAIIIKRYKNPVRLFANDLKALRSTLTGTILGPYFGITFSLVAIENAKVGIAATLMSTVPILMLPIARYVFKEKLNWRAVGGALLAVGGIAILFLR